MYYHHILKNLNSTVRKIGKQLRLLTKALVRAIAQSKKTLGNASNAGFVLPTVTMVMLVVVLMTVAMLLRSFDRAEQARNVRVSQQALSAATPALDRARAKLQYLLREDPSLPRGQTPGEDAVESYLSNLDDERYQERYKFADEEPLKVNDPNDDNNFITTAWRFGIDTDNDGEDDSHTIYGIFLATPPNNTERTSLQARTPPVTLGELQNEDCPGGLSLSGNGWYKNVATSGELIKSFFVYTVTVPIENTASPGIGAFEYQEDWKRVSLSNNAVVYGDDLEISPGPDFRMNGRIITNSNLVVSPFRNDLHLYQVSSDGSCFYNAESSKIIVGGNVVNGMSSTTQRNDVDVDLFQGRGNGVITKQISTTNQSVDNTAFDTIYNNNAYEKRINRMVSYQMEKPETDDPSEVTIVVEERMDDEGTTDVDRKAEIRREEIDVYFRDRTRKVPFAEVPADNPAQDIEYDPQETPNGSGDELRPPDEWILPEDGNTGLNLNEDQLKSRAPDEDDDDRSEEFLGERIIVGNNLPAKWWSEDNEEFISQSSDEAKQQPTGGRWVDENGNPVDAPVRTRKPTVIELPSVGSTDRNGSWERAAGQVPEGLLESIGGLRIVTGAGVYERTNSFLPPPVPAGWTQAPVDDPATTSVTEEYEVVWPDTMPMSPSATGRVYDNSNTPTDPDNDGTRWEDSSDFPQLKGDLQMRATVLYHYAQDPIDSEADPADNDQKPIACISSYYDPTNSTTAANLAPLPDVGFGSTADGKSNNGVVYPPPTTSRPTNATFDVNTGLFAGTNTPELAEQANMVFPDGRFANEPLRKALKRLDNNGDLTLEEQAAIDSTLCSLEILDGTLTPTNTPLDHGVIKEVTLLDARQIKAIDADDPNTEVDETFTLNSTLAEPANLTTNYDLALEERQPLEIRLTQLDLNQMRNQEIDFSSAVPNEVKTEIGKEYLLPNSGIIYASRDDALPDRSDRTPDGTNGIDEDASKALSPTDYKLDPTRRPNGIMLINGQSIARNDGNGDGQNDDGVSSIDDVVKEKGLTLVTNLPVYIHGEFNPHDQEEFTQLLDQDDWSNFYDRTEDQINHNFACRAGDPRISGCNQGDNWRSVTIISDAVTLLSDDNDPDNVDPTLGFRPGFRNEGDFDLRNNTGNLPVVIDNTTTGYDFDPTPGVTTVDETQLGFDVDGKDLDGNGDLIDDPAADPINLTLETDITVAGARMLNGFYGNNFVTNGLSSGAFDTNGDQVDPFDPNNIQLQDSNYSTTSDAVAVNSSYFNNYVTPVQRRGEFPEYVMEMCRKLPVSSCQPGDWFVGDNSVNGNEPANQVIGANVNNLVAGTTARPALDPNDRRYPRRVAFQRNANNLVLDVLDGNNVAIPLGIDGSGNVALFNYPDVPPIAANALWFRTSSNDTDPTDGENYGNTHPLAYLHSLVPATTSSDIIQQPLLVPVLQNYLPTRTPQGDQGNLPNENNNRLKDRSRWLTRASGDTTFNLVVGSGDVPPRPPELNGGLQNLPRFLENWARNNNNNFATNIIGSFMQLNRSAYATAPYPHLPPNGINNQQGANSLFGFRGSYKNDNYNVPNGDGARVGYFLPPTRSWGYDVGLLSQSPDYFSQQLSGEGLKSDPDKYYREVSLDDDWVKTLLCSEVLDDQGQVIENAANDAYRPQDCN